MGCFSLARRSASLIPVETVCLALPGTMQFGEAIEYEEAASILDRATEAGINCYDTAEMYPVPQRQETQGASEQFLGRWLKGRRR